MIYDNGTMKRINRSGAIIPLTTVQKENRDRNSSITILSSSSTVTLKKKKKRKRARRDDDDGFDDDYGDGGDEEEEQETAPTDSNRASWTPELVRTCKICSD